MIISCLLYTLEYSTGNNSLVYIQTRSFSISINLIVIFTYSWEILFVYSPLTFYTTIYNLQNLENKNKSFFMHLFSRNSKIILQFTHIYILYDLKNLFDQIYLLKQTFLFFSSIIYSLTQFQYQSLLTPIFYLQLRIYTWQGNKIYILTIYYTLDQSIFCFFTFIIISQLFDKKILSY